MTDKNKEQEDHPGVWLANYFLKKYPDEAKIVHIKPKKSNDLWEFLKEMDKEKEEAERVNLILD
ncbi:MAG: hypothetical protein CV087_05610 [Candidatus Brocadia sp. WS118]|nr:MAG: hypothetical protein CV087_05610 [Candidatus Brocadia sp. WS118]